MNYASGEKCCRTPGNPYPRGVPILTAPPSFAGRAAGIAAGIALLVFLGSARSESKGAGGDLRTLRAVFRQALLTAILPEKRAYAAQLQGLEKKLAAARDYAAAINVRDERLALEQELTAFEQELPALAIRAAGQTTLLPERIVFRPQDATLVGLKLEKDGTLSGWGPPQCTATWKLPGIPAGGYEVILKYSCADGSGATFEVRESFYLLHGKVAAPAEKQVEKNLGTLRIREGAGPLTLAADGTGQPAQLRVIALELAPVTR